MSRPDSGHSICWNAISSTTRRNIANSTGARPEPCSGRGEALLELAAVTRSFARWIIDQKRLHRSSSLYIVGINGTVGQGKSVFSRALVTELNALVSSAEGLAVTRSLDDYYLPKAERYTPSFLARGYAPDGIPNRGPAGTHDTALLLKTLCAMENGVSPMEFPSFDKQVDDRSPDAVSVRGKIAIFILEGWFVGARTAVNTLRCDPGLKRSVAESLPHYAPVFDRLDALWAFEPPATMEDIVTQRIEQQETLNRETGKPGMTPEQIRRFIDYFYKDSWQEGVTSPYPPKEKTSFSAVMNVRHEILSITPRLQ